LDQFNAISIYFQVGYPWGLLLHFPPLQSAPAFSTPCNYTRAAFSTAVFSVAPIKHPAKISNLLTDRSSHLLVSYTRSVARCVGHFTFWISLSLKISLNPKYELRPKISQKVKLFFVWSHRFAERFAKTKLPYLLAVRLCTNLVHVGINSVKCIALTCVLPFFPAKL